MGNNMSKLQELKQQLSNIQQQINTTQDRNKLNILNSQKFQLEETIRKQQRIEWEDRHERVDWD
jgi:hypothetical protein